MNSENINDYLYTWNEPPPEHLKTVRIDDDIRDGMQAAFIRKPSLAERIELLDLSVKVGTYSIVLGFPAISQQEFDECRQIIKHVEQHNYPVLLVFLARVAAQDLEPIVALSQVSDKVNVRAEMFIGTSTLRRKVENWDLDSMLDRIKETSRYLHANNTGFGLSFEDSTRTPPADLARALDVVLDVGVKDLAICDTVGESTPDGAARITEFYLERIAKAGVEVELVWHGHNDKGLGVANAMAAARAGVHTISGTFLGIGERTGNTALEQVVMQLYQAGRQKYTLDYIVPYCQKLSEYTHTPIPTTAPLVGKQAFATGAGTHSAAVLKARKLGLDFEDYIFSGVPASKLGRVQDVVIGPTSGRYNAHYMLEQVGVPATEELANKLLAYAKSKDRWLTGEEIREYVERSEK